MELYMTEARKLDKFISENLQPNEDFLGRVRRAIGIICEFLRKNCFKDAAPPQPRVLKVIKGGSLGKGTALKEGSDTNLVVFLSVFKDYTDQDKKHTEIVQEIGKRLEEFQENNGERLDVTLEASIQPNLHVLSFKLHSNDLRDSIEFDVLPAFNALGQYKKGSKPDPQVYIDLINSCNSSHQGGEFSTCFAELQKEFIIARPSKLKSLIRLLKHWYKEYIFPYKEQLQKGESLPPKYALELLAVYAWEQGSREPDFDMAEGFRTVLLLLQQYKQLCVFWTTFYDFENETLKLYLLRQLQKPRPIILDPADPTGIVGEGSRWDLLAQEAEHCSRQKCCLPHWDISVRSQCTKIPLLQHSESNDALLQGSRPIECQPESETPLQSGKRKSGAAPSQRHSVLVPESESATFSAMDLYDTNAGRLDKFIFDHLQPDQEFLDDVRWAINFICTFLRENCFKDSPAPRPRVLKVVKGGSSGKGTALKGGSDADLVVFLSIFKRYKDQELNRKGIILEIQKRLEEFKNKQQKNINVIFEPTKWLNPRVLSFRLCSYDREDFIEFDVLPAFDALGQRKGIKPSPEVYIDLIDSSNQSGEFSTCFTELQKDFIIDRPTKLKSLIRLLKHWYKEVWQLDKIPWTLMHSIGSCFEVACKAEMFCQAHLFEAAMYVNNQYRQLPPKYVLELLAVYAWEKGSGKTDFNMAEGFRTVLWLLQQYEHLCIFWTKYYDFRNETLKQYLIGQLRKPRPVILDPADPTGLLGQGSRWDLLAQEAEYCLSQKCCTNDYVPSVLHWDVPVRQK
ncbi:2'-5'-oligoadenylate synthase 3-like [Heteronotia binoei]|uniref:2'-5'-oligoadenylate synthase 3-like n=1 Tax=Heteronotia binoei TaxID=13085 RepID=UPI002930EEE9|nr:2'-5'-oligoadenylate synthase 3-like [Heteronotia binoei]